MNILTHEFKRIVWHCVLNVRKGYPEKWLSVDVSLISPIREVSTLDDQYPNPSKDVQQCDFILPLLVISSVASFWCWWLVFISLNNKCLQCCFTIMVDSFHFLDPFLLSVVPRLVGNVRQQAKRTNKQKDVDNAIIFASCIYNFTWWTALWSPIRSGVCIISHWLPRNVAAFGLLYPWFMNMTEQL